MVKVLTPGSTHLTSVRRHIGYVGREGQLDLETDEAERLRGHDVAETLIERWDLDLEEHRRSAKLSASRGRAPARLVHKLMLSMPAGTPSQGVLRAARSFLHEEFAGKHRYAFVLHTDEPHPHVHVIVKAVNERGDRLHIDKGTLRRWRQGFAAHLRAQGIEANATDRAVRGQSQVAPYDAIFRAAQRGASTHLNRQVQALVDEMSNGAAQREPGKQRLLHTRRQVEAGWLALARVLQREGRSSLAKDIHRYLEHMPPPRTQKEWMLSGLLNKAPASTRRRDPASPMKRRSVPDISR